MITENISQLASIEKSKCLNEAIELLEIGISKDPSFVNPCWLKKFYLINEHRETTVGQSELRNMITTLSLQTPLSVTVLEMRRYILTRDSSNAEITQFFKDLDEAIIRWGDEFNEQLESLKINVLSHLNRIDELRISIDGKIDKIETYPQFAIAVAKIERKKFCDDKKALEILKHVVDFHKDMDAVSDLIKVYLDSGNIDEARKCLTKWAVRLPAALRSRLKSEISISHKDYDAALVEIEANGKEWPELLIAIPYIQILKGANKPAETLLRSRLEAVSFALDADVNLINF